MRGGRHNLRFQSKNGRNHFYRACGTQQMAVCRLGAADRDTIGMLAQHFLDQCCFNHVADFGGGAMRIDIADFFRRDPCIRQARPKASFCPFKSGFDNDLASLLTP